MSKNSKYKYLILDISHVSDGIDNNVYQLGYIIYMNKKYYLQKIYIPLLKNSNIHKYNNDNDKDIREIIFIYTSTDSKACLCMSVFINIGFNDVNIGDNFFNELKSLSTTSVGSGQSISIRNNWLPQNIFPVKKSFLKYNLLNNSNSSTNDNFIFPKLLKGITDVTWILYIKSVYINKKTFNNLINEQSNAPEVPLASLASQFSQNSKGSATLSPVVFMYNDRNIYKQSLKDKDMSVKCFLKDEDKCDVDDQIDSDMNNISMQKDASKCTDNLSAKEVDNLYGNVYNSFMPDIKYLLLVIIKIVIYITLTFAALKVATIIVNKYDNSWIIHLLEYCKWKALSPDIPGKEFKNIPTDNEIKTMVNELGDVYDTGDLDISQYVDDMTGGGRKSLRGEGKNVLKRPLLNYPKKYMRHKNIPNYYNMLRN